MSGPLQAERAARLPAPTLDAFEQLTRDWGCVFPTKADVELAAGLVPEWTMPDRGYRELVEGPRYFLDLSPGVLAVRETDWARAERTLERRARTHAIDQALARGEVRKIIGNVPEATGRDIHDLVELLRQGRQEVARRSRGRRIVSWSRRSRNRMLRRLGQLDYRPLLEHGGVPKMVTLTYAHDWLTVAPNAERSARHLKLFRQRYHRATGRKLVGVWKREFQERGAPHFHILCSPPDLVKGEPFKEWALRTWADVVGHRDERSARWHGERGVSVDYDAGARSLDPVRLARYFLKHGAFAAKDYQNVAPVEWLHVDAFCKGDGCPGCAVDGIGGFWGSWGLSRAVTSVPVSPAVALAAARTLRRHARSRRYTRRVQAKRRRFNPEAATVREAAPRWTTTVVTPGLKGHRGYLLTKDAPQLASQLARYLNQVAADDPLHHP